MDGLVGESWARLWFLGLLFLWAVLLFGGFIFDGGTAQRMPLWTRITSSLVLVVAAWSWTFLGRALETHSFALLIALGMSAGFVGDLFMAGLMPGGRSVLGGIGAFGLGHLFYIVAILRVGQQYSLDAAVPRWTALAVWLLFGVVGWYLVVFRGQDPTALHWAALPYALLLASTAGFATGLAFQATLFVPLAMGGALFLSSDLILAARLFSGLEFPLIGDVIWLTYGPAQMLIVFTVGTILPKVTGT
jgi:hypothetical protein